MATGPRLSMLWESVDPAETLAARFGFADAARAVAWVGDLLADSWAIRVVDCDRLVISGRNLLAWVTTDRGRLVAKSCVAPERFARLADVATLTAWLHARGLPVAAPVPATDGRLRVGAGAASLGVIPVVDGALLDVGEPAQVERAGRMLATLHAALADYPHPFDGGGPGGAGQLVHNDFRSANILHDSTAITAVLDLEEVGRRSRVADLARAAVLLGTRYRDWGPTTADVRDAFVAAYDAQAALSGAERDDLRRDIARVLDHFGWT